MNVKTKIITLITFLIFSIIGTAHATLSTTPDLKYFNKQRNNIMEASQKTGVSPVLITAIANKESGLGRNKINRSSGVMGVMQNTRSTWRYTLKDSHRALGLSPNASVMNDRANILVGASAIAKNKQLLRQATGRTPTDGDLYMAHLLGVGGAIRVLKGNPNTPINRYVKLYAGNRALTHVKGRPMTVSQFRNSLNVVVRKNAAPFITAINQAGLDNLMSKLANNESITTQLNTQG